MQSPVCAQKAASPSLPWVDTFLSTPWGCTAHRGAGVPAALQPPSCSDGPTPAPWLPVMLLWYWKEAGDLPGLRVQ